MDTNKKTCYKNMTIGLVGWYWRGNFGDDLMAVMYALRLKAIGFRVIVWQLSDNIADEYNLEVVQEIDGLVARADVVVYGGGGLFTNAHRMMEPIHDFGVAMDRLCELVRRKNIPLLLSSVGGDGDATVLSRTQANLIEMASLVTLRNEEDTSWFDNFGKARNVYPDIVWRATIDLSMTDQNKKNIVIIHHCGRLEKLMIRLIVSVMQNLGYPTELLSICCERSLGDDSLDCSMRHYSLKSTLELLQRTRLAITHRLHLGMTVLALGGGVFAVRPETKTRLVYERLGLSDYIIRKKKGLMWRLKQLLMMISGMASPPLSNQKMAELASEADKHINEIVRHLDQVCTESK